MPDEEARLQDRLLWGLLIAVGLGVAAWAGWSWLPVPDAVPAITDFQLTERSGRTVTSQDLRGKVWVAGFVFTRCQMSCPKITESMAELQRLLRHTDVQLVSFSLDPGHDTPEVLQRYAAGWRADPDRWWFLTGDKDAIYRIVEESHLSRPQEVPEAPIGERITHTNRLLLVDRQGKIRGSYLPILPLVSAGGDVSRGVFEIDPRQLERLRQDAEELAEGRLIRLSLLPTVNACLNGTSAILLVLGYVFIRQRWVRPHVSCMIGALVVSTLFLACYLYYHFHRLSTPFQGTGWVRPVYFGILLSHTILAMAVLPLVFVTLYHAARGQYAKHLRIARWTLPVWLYVSVTGVVVYLFLYHIYAV
jgi:protein SCO1/2/putative membrane protein